MPGAAKAEKQNRSDISTHQAVADFRLRFRESLESGDFTGVIPREVFAMAFSLSGKLLRELYENRLSVMFRAVEKGVEVRMARPTATGVDLVRAAHDEGYRKHLLKTWYERTARALQTPDDDVAFGEANQVLFDSIAPLGLVEYHGVRGPSMFSISHPQRTERIRTYLSRLIPYYEEEGFADRYGIYQYLSILWSIIGFTHSALQQQFFPPNYYADAVTGSRVSSW